MVSSHPHFRFLLKLAVILVTYINIISSVLALALTYIDNSQATFAGTFGNTFWNTSKNGVSINSAYTDCTSLNSTNCIYTSDIKNSGDAATIWNSLAWTPNQPYLKELPNNQGVERDYPGGNVDMTNNLALWHLNETVANATSFADSSGNGNNLFCGPNCPVISTVSPWGNARATNATSRYFVSSNGNSIKGLSRFSLSIWVTDLTNTGVERVLYEEPVSTTNANDRVSLRITAGGQLVFRGRTDDAAASASTWVSIPTPGTGTFSVVAVFDSVSDIHSLYVNGIGTFNTVTESSFPNTNPFSPPRIGRSSNNVDGFGSNFDEVAIFSKALTTSDAVSFYKRGVNMNARFQIRSCNNSLCSGSNFVGPDGSATTFFTEQTQTIAGSPSFALNTTITPNNQYIQYRFYLNSIDSTLTPVVKNVTINNQIRPNISFGIRNLVDTASSNSCNLGTVSITSLASCSYRLKVSTNDTTGYTILAQTSGNLGNGINSIANAAPGISGGGGTTITAATAGTERYGVAINTGSLTSGGSITRPSGLDAGSSNSVLFNSTSAIPIIQATGVNLPASTDTINTALVTHNLNISPATSAGNYVQSVTYTVIPNF